MRQDQETPVGSDPSHSRYWVRPPVMIQVGDPSRGRMKKVAASPLRPYLGLHNVSYATF